MDEELTLPLAVVFGTTCAVVEVVGAAVVAAGVVVRIGCTTCLGLEKDVVFCTFILGPPSEEDTEEEDDDEFEEDEFDTVEDLRLDRVGTFFPCFKIRCKVEFHRFLMALSVRPGNNLAISAHRFPNRA